MHLLINLLKPIGSPMTGVNLPMNWPYFAETLVHLSLCSCRERSRSSMQGYKQTYWSFPAVFKLLWALKGCPYSTALHQHSPLHTRIVYPFSSELGWQLIKLTKICYLPCKEHYARIRGVVVNYLASQARDHGVVSHQHLKDSWHIWRHLIAWLFPNLSCS